MTLTIEHQTKTRSSWENWLSPVIQVTWEARTVGWLEKKELLPLGRSNSVTAVIDTLAMGRSTEEI